MIVTGHIVFGNDAVAFDRASLRVKLEDSTYADAPATVLAEITRLVRYAPAQSAIEFELLTDAIRDPSQRWTVRAVIDVDGDGTIGRGDYMNVVSVLVPEGERVSVTIPVRRV